MRWRWRPPIWFALAAGALVLVIVGAAAWWVVGLDSRARAARQHLEGARAALSESTSDADVAPVTAGASSSRTAALARMTAACADAAQADALLRDIGAEVETVMPLLDALAAVPGVGTRTRAQTATLETGAQLAAASNTLCTGMQPLAALLDSSDQNTTGGARSARDALRAVLAARPKLIEAADSLERVVSSANAIPDAELDAAAQTGVATLRSRLPTMVQTLRDTAALLDLLGAQGERRFLLVSQNPDELRATGGFIGSAGVISASNGDVRLVEYGSSRLYDTPTGLRAPTPSDFTKYLGEYWLFAAANWSPSFPDVARQLAYFYSLSHPDKNVDGVIALDQFGLQALLEVLGPVDVPEYGERVGASEVQAALDRHVHAGDAFDERGRKQFTAALSMAVLDRLLVAPERQVPDLVRAVRKLLDQQHLLVAVREPSAAATLARRRWDGALLPAERDSLLVVDTEVSYSKQSQMVRRDVAYSIDLGHAGGPRGRVAITYTNQSRPDLRPNVQFFDDYRTYMRVYAPRGAMLTDTRGFDGEASTAEECGRSVFGGEILIPRGKSAEVVLEYRLPPSIVHDGQYELVVQHQPGVPPGSVAVAVARPDGTNISIRRDNEVGHHYRFQIRADGLVEAPLGAPDPGGCAVPLVAAAPIAAPTWLDIPSAHISAPVVGLGVDANGIMEAPATPDVVGWYRMSARAGQPGNSVLSGHVDWGTNTAVFWGLRNLAPSDFIVLHGEDSTQHRYAVQWNRVYSRDDPALTSVVRGVSGSVLTLITCEGVYDRTSRDYSDRRIVRATLSE